MTKPTKKLPSRPDPAAWAGLLARLDESNAIFEGKAGPRFKPHELLGVMYSLSALHDFFRTVPEVVAGRLHMPFWRLFVALADVSQGRLPDLLEVKGRPKAKGVAGDFTMAFAAIAMDELMNLGEPLRRAAAKVGRVLHAAKLPERPRAGATYTSMVQGWRERLMEGEGSAPFGALHIWEHRDVYLSVIEGTREERVTWLLDMLRFNDGLHWR